jgi:hypothetical protein
MHLSPSMRHIALLTTLALAGSSAVALSDPDRTYGDRDRYGHRDRYDRYENSRYSREYRGRWVSLADRYSASTKRQFIKVNGRFNRIRVEATRGAPVISQVGIEFVDGNTQVVNLGTRLTRGEGEVIRVNRDERVKRIIVYTQPRAGGSYSVYGA